VNWNVLERKLKNDICKLLSFGGASRDRTDDLIVANDALSQLSYSPLQQRSFLFLILAASLDFAYTRVILNCQPSAADPQSIDLAAPKALGHRRSETMST
jgi:hypothetical protein